MLDEREADAARRVDPVAAGSTQGPEVAAFEKDFAAFVGAPHACAVSNCTTALHLALLARRRRSGRRGHHRQPFLHRDRQLRSAIAARRPSSSISRRRLQHRSGADRSGDHAAHPRDPLRPSDRHALRSERDLSIARRTGCLSSRTQPARIGSEINWNGDWERIGAPHGDVACFSFHPRKVMTTGDGGMITTANPEWDAKFRLLRQHGMSVPDTVRHGSRAGHLRELSDRRLQLPHDRHSGRDRPRAAEAPARYRREPPRARRALYGALQRQCRNRRRPSRPWARSNWQSYCVRLPDGAIRKP